MSSAAILNGGQALRFGGHDKGGLLVDGRSILERQLDELAAIADDILIVGGQPTPPARHAPRVRMVPDRVTGCGPLGGLDAALDEAHADPLIIVACDMPFVTAAFLAHLRSLTEAVDAVVPKTERGYHPVCAVYTQACRPLVRRALAERRLSMTELLARMRVRAVGEREIDAFGPCTRLLANVNTPAELHDLGAQPGHEL